MYKLVLSHPRLGELDFPLEPGVFSVGRGSENDLVVPDGWLSRRHFELRVGAAGVSVVDLDSTNGTFVGGRRIERPHVLALGARLTCGDGVFRIESLNEGGNGGSATWAGPALESPLDARPSVELDQPRIGSETRAHEKLAVLLKVSQTLSSPASLDRVLDRILGLVFDVLEVDRGGILLLDDDQRLEARVVQERGQKSRSGDAVGGLYSETIARYVIDRNVAAVFIDALEDSRIEQAASVLDMRIRSCMCAPLKPGEETLGVLYVDNLEAPAVFGNDDLELLSAFANQAAVAIQNSILFERLEREAVTRSHLQRFFPPKVVDTLVDSDGSATQVMETQVTALFCDICGFTEMSATMPPREVVQMLNEYFPRIAGLVFDHDGTLEKYIGDAMLAIWGAPFRQDDDANRAVLAAAEMQRAVTEMSPPPGREPVRIHIGLSTGPVAAGNIGTASFLQYATIGHTTNLASRICSLAGPGEVLLSEATAEELVDTPWAVEELEPARLKGLRDAQRIFRLRWEGLVG